jgi:hypothetical protein
MTQTGEYRLRRSSGGMRERGMLPIGYLRDPNCVEEINNLDPSLETNHAHHSRSFRLHAHGSFTLLRRDALDLAG